jgi:hypothetical protein
MKFKDVIKNTPWETVDKYLREATPNSNAPSYKHAYNLLRLEAKPNERRIVIEVIEPEAPSEIEDLESIGTRRRGTKAFNSISTGTLELPDQEIWLGLDLTPMDDWLGTEVDLVHLQQFDPAELVAHHLKKLTFHCFEPSELQTFFERLEDRSQAVEAMTPDELAAS